MPDYGQLGNYLFNTHLRATGSARSALLPSGAQLNSIVIHIIQKGLPKTLQTHRGWWPMNDLEAYSCNIHLRVGHQSIGKAVSILFVVLDTRNGQYEAN